MTTAVLNSVESDKSGVASAVNGAIREIGTAFGIALLGTIMNRTYQREFSDSAEIDALAQNPELAGVIAFVEDGASNAGQVIDEIPEFAGMLAAYPAEIQTIIQVSSEAFVSGMDAALVLSGIGIIAASILSYFMIDDAVVETPVPDPAAAPEADLAPRPAD